MSRHIIHIISMTTIAVSIFSAPLASAKQPTNPLHPSYFAAKSAANTPIAGADAMRYVEARNPLHPMFARAGKASNWHAA